MSENNNENINENNNANTNVNFEGNMNNTINENNLNQELDNTQSQQFVNQSNFNASNVDTQNIQNHEMENLANQWQTQNQNFNQNLNQNTNQNRPELSHYYTPVNNYPPQEQNNNYYNTTNNEPNFTMHNPEGSNKKNSKNKKEKKEKTGFRASSLVAVGLCGILFGGAVTSAFTLNGMRESIVNEAVSKANENQSNYTVTTNSYSDEEASSKNANTDSNSAISRSEVIENVRPAVVNIQVAVTSQFGMTEEGAGTGFVFKEDNDKVYIVTNNHVVEGASQAAVYFEDIDTPINATLVGTDASNDTAIISVKKEDLNAAGITNVTTVVFGNSDDLKVGDSVIAIGNALGEGITSTGGMISSVNKEITIDGVTLNVIQTDAAINPGNSGGPLINEKGEVIGMNTAKIMGTYEGSVEGVGYSISSNKVVEVIDEIFNKAEGPFLGIQGRDVNSVLADAYSLPIDMGVYVVGVIEGGSAEAAGVEANDIITSFNGQTIPNMETLQELILNCKVGDKVDFKVLRNGEVVDLSATLQKRSETGF